MKIFKHYLFIAAALITMISFTSCDTEEDMERALIEGYQWKGQLPIENKWGDDFYGIYTFIDNYNGVEKLYVNGRLDSKNRFSWYWHPDHYRTLILDFSTYWHLEAACIADVSVYNGILTGTFYEDVRDFEDGYFDMGSPIRLIATDW